MGRNDLWRVDPKCWVCGVFTTPTDIYEPLRCKDHQEKKIFVFVRYDTLPEVE